MAGICFYYEPEHVDVFSGRDSSLDAWNYAVKAAGDIDQCCIIDTVGTAKAFDADLPTQIVASSAAANLTGTSVVIDVPWASNPGVSLWSFDHAVDWYIFGPAAGWTQGATDGLDVMHVPQAGTGALHSVHIASVIMLHRFHVIGGA